MSCAALGIAVILSGCASRLLTVGEWAQSPDLRLDNKSLQNTNVKITCYRINPDGTLSPRTYQVCSGLAAELEAYGAAIVDQTNSTEDETTKFDYTIQYVDLRQVQSDSSIWSLAASSVTAWIVPLVTTTQTSAEFRILDHRGVLLDRIPMTIAKVTVFGWSAVMGFFEKSENEQKKLISRQVYAAARNRLASLLRAKQWAQP